MTGLSLLLLWVWPLLLAAVAVRERFWWLPAVGAVPALAAALTVPAETVLELPWLFLGTHLGLDPVARVYLLFTALLWLAAGVYAAFAHRGTAHAGRFNVLFLLAMTGNLWLIVGQDLFSFYVGFAIMGVASYGLVIHDGRPESLRAGKVYLVMTLLGEVCLFAALVMIASTTGTTVPAPDDLARLDGLTVGLLLVGLGVKAGMVPLHVWLPLAHPAAPVAASAVLSGTMIKTALLGWMRFLPIGAVALPDWGGLLATAGILTLFFALPIGLAQSDPKVVLAYSSISKMGLMILVLGLALLAPALAPIAVAGIAFYAASHALVKGGLFLGVGLRKHAASEPPLVQALVLGALIFLALALAGAPFTSGAVAKYELKPILTASDWAWVGALVAVSTMGTTLLMVRFVWVSFRTEPHPEPGYRWPGIAWALLIGLVALFPFVLAKPAAWPTNLVSVATSLDIGLFVLLLALFNPRIAALWTDRVPPGDLLSLWAPLQRGVVAAYAKADARRRAWLHGIVGHLENTFERTFASAAPDTERGLRQWPVAGAVWVGISMILLLTLVAGLHSDPGTATEPQPRPAAAQGTAGSTVPAAGQAPISND